MGEGMSTLGLPQPFGFYHILTDTDDLHFGYWPEEDPGLSLSRAQQALTALLFELFPQPPARILDVGCGLGATAGDLSARGYEVSAIAPSHELIVFAEQYHPGPKYLSCGFLEDHQLLDTPQLYDLILFQESLQYFPQLAPVFQKAKKLLVSQGRIVLCDEVSYSPRTREKSAVHSAGEIERCLGEAGFCIRRHKRIGPQVIKTCREILGLFEKKKESLIRTFGDNAKDLVDHYTQGWKKQLDWYSTGCFGYEVWDVRPDRFTLRPYMPGDEEAILEMFQQIFGVQRSMEHWKWEFLRNPFGGPLAITVWDGEELVSHYSAYPVPFWIGDHMTLIHQVGDTMTRPSHRGVGRGPTSLLARMVRLFHRLYCEGRVPFFYGFNTGKHQKFGRMFLRYIPVAPVYEWILDSASLTTLLRQDTWRFSLLGYSAEAVKETKGWAEDFFEKVRGDYGWLVARNASYLKWRYLNHPDYDYTLILVRRWGRPVGWWLGRIEGNTLLIGDALFDPKIKYAPQVGLASWLRLIWKQGIEITEIRGWFSRHPRWWTERLYKLGFKNQKERQNLDLCVTIFSENLSSEEFSEMMYFTYGDSDLF
jgi:SAM-dependent methyltransferase